MGRGRYFAGPVPTLGSALDAGDRVTVHCEASLRCMHNAPLDIGALALRRGRDFMPGWRRLM
jgi:hypothetical protein